ncbi:hypothetical protein ES703_66174 [subsurface metagenome]
MGVISDFSCMLISHLSDELELLYFPDLKSKERQVDAIICLGNSYTSPDVLIEAKNREETDTSCIDQLESGMLRFNVNTGFLVTKSRIAKTQIERIKLINKNDKDFLIVPVQGPHIEEFLKSDQATKEFLLMLSKSAKYNIEKLIIKK